MTSAAASASSSPPRASSPRQRRRPGENRAGLIAAGIVEFGLRGYFAAQTSAIARRAGVSQPNVYANFASKQELFVACLRELLSTDDNALGADLTDEHRMLLLQGVAVLGDAQLASAVQPVLAQLRAEWGTRSFDQALLGAVNALGALER